MTDLIRLARKAIISTVINEGVPAVLGKTDGATVRWTDDGGTLRQNWVWARVGGEGKTDEVVVKNGGIPLMHGLPIRIADRNGVPTAIGIDQARAEARTGGYPIDNIPFHAWAHARLGPDPLYIEGLSFLPLVCRPSDPPALTVAVHGPAFYRYQGVDKVWETADSGSLSSYVPTAILGSDQHFVIISLDRSTNALVITDGTDKTSTSSDVPFTASDVSAIVDTISIDYWPIAAIRFYYGQTQVDPADIFMDLRLWAGSDFAIETMTEQTDPTGSGDYVAIYDGGLSAYRKVLLDNIPGGQGGAATLFAQVVDETIANTTDESSLMDAGAGSRTLAANFFSVGTTIRLKLAGHVSTTGAPTLNVKVKLGGTELGSTGAQSMNTGVSTVEWHLDIIITCRTTGASGTVVASGLFEHDDGGVFGITKTTATTIDTTAENLVEVTGTWGTASASNTITTQEAVIEHLSIAGLADVGPSDLTAAETV